MTSPQPSARMLDLAGMPYAAAAFRLMAIGLTKTNAVLLAAAKYDACWIDHLGCYGAAPTECAA